MRCGASLPCRARPGRAGAIVAFFVQLTLNAAWSFAFFAQEPARGPRRHRRPDRRDPATIRAFWRLDRTAGLLLLPYLAWVSYATLLNGTIWQLNG